MKKITLFGLSVATVFNFSFAKNSIDVSEYEARLAKLSELHGKVCAPDSFAQAEVLIEILKDKNFLIKPNSIEYISYPNRIEYHLSSIESGIYSDKDGDGIPCYKEVELGLDPNVFNKLEKEERREFLTAQIEQKEEVKEVKKVGLYANKKEFYPFSQPLRVHFHLNSAKIKKEYLPYLNILIKYLKANPETKVKVIGYTDNIGSQRYNQILATRRALEIKNYLVKNGIDQSRVTIDAFGKDRYLITNETSIDRFTNRRAEFYIVRVSE